MPSSTIQKPTVLRQAASLGRFWTVANMLSLVRVPLAVPITYLIVIDGSMAWLMGLIGVAVITDWFDGRLARWSHTVSEWGKVLDPLSDKVMAAGVTLGLVLRGSLPVWFMALVLLRDVLIVIGGIVVNRHTGEVLMSIRSGKVAVTALAVTVVAALLKADPPILAFCVWATTALLVYSFVRYLLRAIWTVRNGSTAEDEPVLPRLTQTPEPNSHTSA